MIKIKHLVTVLFLTFLSTFSIGQQIEMIPLPPQQATFTLWTRGFHFQSPLDMKIISLRVPTTVSTGPQSIAVVNFLTNQPPPAFPGMTSNYDELFYVSNDPSMTEIPVDIDLLAGQWYGVYGSRNGANSYGTIGPWMTQIFGENITLSRSGTQTNIATNWPNPIWSEVGFRIGRIEVTCQLGGGGGGNHCDPSDCLIVECPPDITVTCIEDFIANADDAIATITCTSNNFGAPGGSNINGGGLGGDASGTAIATPGEGRGMGTYSGGFNGTLSGVQGPIQAFTDLGFDGGNLNLSNMPVKPDRNVEIVGGTNSRMLAVTSYTNRAAFEGDACNLETEDFENSNFPNNIVACDFLPISSAGSCLYPAGEIIPGFSFHSAPNAQMVIVGPGFFGNPDYMVGPNFFADNGFIDLDPGIVSIGFDLPSTPFLGQTTVTIFGASGVLGSEVFTPGFVGFTSDEEITRLEFSNTSGTGGELISNLSFGTSCGGGALCTEAFRYVDQPQATGAHNCPGTTYEIVYHVGDDCGNVGCCVQTVTIENAPPIVTVTPGETVSCYEDIEITSGDIIITDGDPANEDVEVTTSCGEGYSLKILPPIVEGIHECPGTTYTYGYRVRDNCGREVIANRVFTIGNNAPPSIVAPPDMTIPCSWNAEVNPEYAEVTTGCTLGYVTTVSGPSVSGAENCPGATYTYTYTVTDDCGRTASDVRTFTIANEAPTFLNCPDVPLQLNCEDEGWENIIQAWLASVEAESSCSESLTVSNNYNPFTQGLCINNGTKRVRFFATDACGRTSTCEGMIIVADTEAPIFVTPPQDYLTVCNYITQDKLDAWVDDHGGAEVEDCWDNVTWSTFPNNPTISCDPNMPTSLTVTFVATDGCGNKASMDATFTALPTMGGMAGENGDEAADHLQLFQNQPNPFKDETTISFYLPQATKASLSIYDLSGKLLKQIEGDYSEGMNVEEINRSDLQGAGVLYYKLSTATETATLKMILLD